MSDIIKIKIHQTAAEIEQIKAFWQDHNAHPEGDLEFVSLLAGVRPEIARLYVVCASRGPTPVALLIGRVEHTIVRPRLGYLKLFPVKVKQIIFVREGYLGEDSQEVLRAMLARIAADCDSRTADYAVFSNLPRTGALWRLARTTGNFLQRDRSKRVIQHWRASLPESPEDLFANKSRKHRSELRRTAKVLEKQFPGAVRYQVFEQPTEVDAFCRAAERVAQSTYQRALGAGFADNAENRGRLQWSTRRGFFRGYVLFVEERPVAFWAGEIVGLVMWLTWTGFDSEFKKHEVGTILLLRMLEDLIGRGVKQIDYGLGWAHYKERFADTCLEEQNVAIYARSFKGVALNGLATIENVTNRVTGAVLQRLQLTQRAKKVWRTFLASRRAKDGIPQPPARQGDEVLAPTGSGPKAVA